MKNLVYVVFVLFLGLSLSSNIYSQQKEKKEIKKETMKETMKESTQEKETTKNSDKTIAEGKAFNSVCPVTGEDADKEITYTYNGKTYSFCCKKCLKKFKADPEKYSSNISDDGKTFKKK